MLTQIQEHLLQKLKVFLCCITMDDYVIQENFYSLSSISMNRLFIGCINVAGAYIRPIGTTKKSICIIYIRLKILLLVYPTHPYTKTDTHCKYPGTKSAFPILANHLISISKQWIQILYCSLIKTMVVYKES